MAFQMIYIFSGKKNVSLVLFVKSGHNIEECRFSGTVWTDQAAENPFFNIKSHFIDGDQPAKGLCQILYRH
jgi:hypothetical protein